MSNIFSSTSLEDKIVNENTSLIEIPEYPDKEVIGGEDYIKNLTRNPVKKSLNYVKGTFPCIDWLPHYFNHPNWILSDFITGVTVAIVLIPQSMSYAKLANLDIQFGLYSAFIGTFFYFLFATSREICIGPVAVLSTEVGKIITRVQAKYGDEYSANEIATTLSLISGGIVLGIGILRLGFIVELISLPAILAFTTGSAFNIVCGQLAGLMGYTSKVKKESSTYLTLIQFLKHLPDTKVDAAFGLVGLFVLYVWQILLNYLIKKNRHNPKRKLIYTYILNLRTAFVIIISTCISFGILRYKPHVSKKAPYSIIGKVPSGLNHVGRFIPPPNLAKRLANELPISTIVLVLEHISISKSFARINGYRVNANQEFTAIGFTNMIGTFFGAYPVTGSFSRTALSAKCGVKTPFKSAFTGACVLLAIYCFTSGFYYIPNATLSAIIIHCVAGLLTNYELTTKLYMFSPVDFVIFIVGVFVTVFATIEDGIYWAICASCATLLWRMLLPNGVFLGRIKVFTIRNPTLLRKKNNTLNSEAYENQNDDNDDDSGIVDEDELKANNIGNNDYIKTTEIETANSISSNINFTYKWVPLPKNELNSSFIHTRYINNRIQIEDPPSGVLVYRVSENFIYTNCSLQIDSLISYVRKHMRPFDSDRERLWSEYSWDEKDWDFKNWKFSDLKPQSIESWFDLVPPKVYNEDDEDDYDENAVDENGNRLVLKPKLKILHLDFSQVVAIDSTSIQALLDLKRSIDDYCGTKWEFHFSGIINPWVIRGLVNAGFGGKDVLAAEDLANNFLLEKIHSIPFFKNKGYSVEEEENYDPESGIHDSFNYGGDLEVSIDENGKLFPIFSTIHPNFHVDIPSYTEYD
ncbi:hypothetical protein C6P40_002195 [Pichia californica]|uniref:STAS domain-containing protein n=1 Tax=Pichia californica TaxID=460514 RepID=A0A9P7BFD0_9ASCO|nr:hypothetical protein C6P40_002195 [[Candida] californica]